jgi:endonuclease III related protein
MANTCPCEQALRAGTGHFLDLCSFAGYLAKVTSSTQHLAALDNSLVPIAKILSQPRQEFISRTGPRLHAYYETLFAAYGPQNWWPGRTRFEVIVGAILTQNTSWSNVSLAIENLRRNRLLTISAIASVRPARLQRAIRPSGYFRQKSATLKAFVRFLRTEYAGSLTQMFKTPTLQLRRQLLAVRGIGPETADCILLYAGKHPVFVVDAYTRRILERHGHINARASYEDIRAAFERVLPADATIYNEFHALIVNVGKQFCRPQAPRCSQCPLNGFLPQNPVPSS